MVRGYLPSAAFCIVSFSYNLFTILNYPPLDRVYIAVGSLVFFSVHFVVLEHMPEPFVLVVFTVLGHISIPLYIHALATGCFSKAAPMSLEQPLFCFCLRFCIASLKTYKASRVELQSRSSALLLHEFEDGNNLVIRSYFLSLLVNHETQNINTKRAFKNKAFKVYYSSTRNFAFGVALWVSWERYNAISCLRIYCSDVVASTKLSNAVISSGEAIIAYQIKLLTKSLRVCSPFSRSIASIILLFTERFSLAFPFPTICCTRIPYVSQVVFILSACTTSPATLLIHPT